MQMIYLIGDPDQDETLRLREQCGAYHNNAWICRRHGSIDFKLDGKTGLTRYLKGEIAQQGLNIHQMDEWEQSQHGETCCCGGVGYEGRLRLGSIEAVMRFLQNHFEVEQCPRIP
jgi:hypothetical protein